MMKLFYKLCLLCLIVWQVTAFGQKDYSNKLTTKAEFINFAGKPLTDKFTNLKSVKIVYDYGSKKLYFFNSVKYTYHHDFCEDELNFKEGIHAFNQVSYNPTNKRGFLLANLNYLESSDDWIMELAASDQMNATLINSFFNIVKSNVFFWDKLKFYLSTPRLIELKGKGELKIPTVLSDFMFNRITEQSIENATAVGILKKYDVRANPKFYPNPNEIIIINTTPEFIPPVKGVIVTELQTPLSHLVLLAKNRNIPVYVDTKAWDKENLNNLLDKKVELTTTESAYKIGETSKPISANKVRKKIVLTKDLSVKTLVDLQGVIPMNSQNIIGSKATNLGLLKQVEKEVKTFKTPEYAFGIPFYFYEQHMKENHFDVQINEILAMAKDQPQLVAEKLKALRKAIKQSKVNPELIAMVNAKLGAQSEFKNFKFRSSTNAEDLDGFNGAGLYDSKGAVIGDAEKTAEKAILDVWSSFWNERAFQERELFNIDHLSCAMGILVHRSFPNETANGVLVTRNIYREKYAGITVNVQKGDASVVKPDAGVTCDEFYTHNFNGLGLLNSDYRSTSSLNNGKPILNDAQIKTLFTLSPILERKMNALWKKRNMSSGNRPLDIEFKIDGKDNQLYIKQARAYMD